MSTLIQDPNYPEQVLNKASNIKLLICDVDGVLSNGQVIIGNNSEELKTFNIKDGFGIKCLQKSGIAVAIITGRNSKIVEKRCQELGIEHYYQGQSNKQEAFDTLCKDLSVQPEQICHIGDDLPDLPLLVQVGLGVTVADGHWLMQQHADWITQNNGGFGAVREVCDLILHSQNKLEAIHQDYLTKAQPSGVKQ
ncbi:3-deoxy-manno-octulosonate-8-phosphatase KdsC [Kangiella koreensis]|uniref:3-deoxy-D-manno-octulosonate 8-phosphate phosphatase KdsC n=1 Tax=Kangiella koreensis (strain DSM 16069 / JCM 12317 / KCTC 12182 / SW-125) TaxID=523791 RepID=C7R9I1_KANKD|nr:3-deoxy-manno-octulosonate-8-phosphatase KdsC [Kangiella koreensis]ACV26072.1 3-deoxy-D-manno-octulosonate 8-phosphate phosphatase, YrbI family [Kangiella koreensis DSM 16069]